ncbi:MAG: membrane protein insertase YidC [Simkaniaceae bacterium]|nr:membrane protein insertase YidC [Simkaniaceae bacterium]
MDRKSIIFILLLTVALFFSNQWFASGNEEAIEQKRQEEQQKQAQASERLQSDLRKRTARPSDLPLTVLYSDAAGKDPVAYAIMNGDVYISQAWTGDLPEHVYVRAGKKGIEKLNRMIDANNSQKAIVYGTTKPQIDSAYLPTIGMSDVQVVSLNASGIVIKLAEYEDGRLYFPSGKPEVNSIVLYNFDGNYMPVGFWEASNDTFHTLKDVSQFQDITSFKTLTTEQERALGKEQFYVLENEYQQLVFSNIGGALAEINLPYNETVKPIGFDRTILNKHAANARFPNHAYWSVEDGKTVQKQPKLGGYTPLIRRSLKAPDGKTAFFAPSRYYAMNLVGEDSDIHTSFFRVTKFTDEMIEFEGSSGGRRFIKTYTLPAKDQKAPYCVTLTVRSESGSRELWLTTGVPEVELISGAASPELQQRYQKGSKTVVEKVSLPKTSTTITTSSPDWISDSNGFFGMILDPLSENMPTGFKAYHIPGQILPTRLTLIDAAYNQFPADKYPGYEMLLPLKKGNGVSEFRLFAGPYQHDILNQVDATYSNPSIGYNPDYAGAQTYHGWFSFISQPFARFLFMLMRVFYSITHSWGFSIILLTIALRVMLYPLNNWSIKSTVRMQQVAPKVTKIQERYKKDPKRAQMEVMKLYKEEKVNPFSGCLPILIQMPFLIGMFDLLKSNFDLRGASFIPGWINNLTAPDVLFSWGYPIFFIGNQFHLLPIVLGGLMFLQQKISQAGSTATSEQAQQQKMMGNVMSIVFTFLFYNFPSGLNIYWISSTVLAMLQQYFLTKKLKGKIVTTT